MQPFPLAFPHVSDPLFQLDQPMLESGFKTSAQSPRKRIILPIHRTADARVQRMINFLQPDSYIRPHQHPRDHASETVLCLHGALDVIHFDSEGVILSRHPLRSPMGLLDLEPRIWHTFVILEPDTAVLEIKLGPYDTKTDKLFPSWAPEEQDPASVPYLNSLRST